MKNWPIKALRNSIERMDQHHSDSVEPSDGATGIGIPVRRKEDVTFLTGRGQFMADLSIPGALQCFILRSPHAAAKFGKIDTSKAASADGVVAIFTGADMAADGVGQMTCLWPLKNPDGTPMAEPLRWALARDAVHHVGQPVVAVIAETIEQARDASEQVDIDYTVLPAVTHSARARETGAPQVHPDAPGNVGFTFHRGDTDATDVAFAKAEHVSSIELINNRLAGAAIENRSVIGHVDPITGHPILYTSTQAPHLTRRAVAEELGLFEGDLRVVAPDVGGGFGYKGKHYPEETIMTWAAMRLGRPVRWIGGRDEAFVSDTQGRDHITRGELALDADGSFLGLRVNTLANMGAYVSTFGANIPTAIYAALLIGVYKTPAIAVEITAIFTNTVPTDAYRGAGRPEACYLLERLADRAADEMGIDRADIRRRNMIQPEQMPYTTPIGPTYDTGNFPKIFEAALDSASYQGFEARREAAAAAGKLRGLGMAMFVETSGVAPSKFAGMMGAKIGMFEAAHVRADPSGGIRAALGTHNHGQGHATTFAQIISDRTGVPLSKIEIVEGDTAVVPLGTGTFGSRSIAVGGSALQQATVKIIEKGRRLAAHLLEAATGDIEFADGQYRVAGTDRVLTFPEICRAAYTAHSYPDDGWEPGLDENAVYDPSNFAFSNGAHVCELEVDAETGRIELIDYHLVDDIGTVINPMIVEGQVHGGLAQGIGQAIMEDCRYDPANGQMVAGSFMDYAIPAAADLPPITSQLDQSQPCSHNPLGAKGCGESGAIGAPAAVVGAVLDALSSLGVREIDMPLTPEMVWRAINEAD